MWTELQQLSVKGSVAAIAHLTLGVAAYSAAQVADSSSCPGQVAVDAAKLYLLAPELQQEPSPDRLFARGLSPADWESSS